MCEPVTTGDINIFTIAIFHAHLMTKAVVHKNLAAFLLQLQTSFKNTLREKYITIAGSSLITKKNVLVLHSVWRQSSLSCVSDVWFRSFFPSITTTTDGGCSFVVLLSGGTTKKTSFGLGAVSSETARLELSAGETKKIQGKESSNTIWKISTKVQRKLHEAIMYTN